MGFHYNSTQVHAVEKDGVEEVRKNTVNIENGKGTKTVELTKNGQTRKVTHKLTASQVKKIQNNQFIPGLFKSCHDCLNTRTQSRQTRRNSKKRESSRK
jgi:hypothetical protein